MADKIADLLGEIGVAPTIRYLSILALYRQFGRKTINKLAG